MAILMMILIIVVDVLAIVSLIWNIRSVRRAEYALKKINKRVKDLEESDKTAIHLMVTEDDGDDIQVDPESDPEAPEEDSGALSAEAEGDI